MHQGERKIAEDKKDVKGWRCNVCGYIHKDKSPPKNCPQCSSDFNEFSKNENRQKLYYDNKKYDMLLINGSSHRSHNTGHIMDIAEEELKKKGISYMRFNLNEYNIKHCWCCYTMEDAACTYPCRDQIDDIPAMHEYMINSKAVIVASPINWNNMSARLKDFLDRLTSLQNQALLGKDVKTKNKIVGILINGHEDGAMKTFLDIFTYFQQLGFILAPYGFTYATHGSINNTKTDNKYFKSNEKLEKEIRYVVNNVIEMTKLDLEVKLKAQIRQVSE